MATTKVSGADERPERIRDAERTRAELLAAATHEFADQGYAGARVDEIAARTRTTKRMIYYYFGGKQGLYLAVLESAYARIRSLEQTLEVDHLEPAVALRHLAEITFDHHEEHHDFVRLVSIENIHHAEHLRQSQMLPGLAAPALDVLGRILDGGRKTGVFRDDLDALDVHMIISSFCIFRGANRYTFGAIFERDLMDPKRRAQLRRLIGDLVVDHMTTLPPKRRRRR